MGRVKKKHKLEGKWIMVEFYDHFISDHKSTNATIRIAGYVESVDRLYMHLHSWHDLADGSEGTDHEHTKILISTIKRWAHCEPRKWYTKV